MCLGGVLCSVDGTCLQDLKQDTAIFEALHYASLSNDNGVMDTSIVIDENGEEHADIVTMIQERDNLNPLEPSLVVSNRTSEINFVARKWTSEGTTNFGILGNASGEGHIYSDAQGQTDVSDSINLYGSDGKVDSPHTAWISLVNVEGVVGNVVSVPQGANYSACRRGESPRITMLCDPGATAFGCDKDSSLAMTVVALLACFCFQL